MTSYQILKNGVKRYVSSFDDNRFAACKAISNDAVALMKNAFNSISESEAIACVLANKQPEDLRKRIKQHMNLSTPKTTYMKNLLAYVDDDNIVSSVNESYSESVRLSSLTFYYEPELPSKDKARVRVLTRMCWFNRKGE